MKIINLLDEKTINKIAAGEVIERPLSIIKELVENSIDAGASEITIEIKKSGASFIRITDNGSGISSDDMDVAFLRHATSKIKNASDLETIESLGFRGEALSSIVAVSKSEIISKRKEDSIGTKVKIEGGKLIYKEDAGAPNGTIFTVEDLFFNTPARKKFLKSDSRETALITEVVEKIALSNPNISIRYRLNDKVVFLTPGNGELSSVIRTVYGKKIYDNLIPVDVTFDSMKVHGYIGNSTILKGNRKGEVVFVNGRIIKNNIISSAVEKAYKSMLPINKFPFFVLNVDFNPEFIDVNVHPTKAEVKFQDDQRVFKGIYLIIREQLIDMLDFQEVKDEKSESEFNFKENVSYVQGKLDYNQVDTIKADGIKKEEIDSLKFDENVVYTNINDNSNKPSRNDEEVNHTKNNIATTSFNNSDNRISHNEILMEDKKILDNKVYNEASTAYISTENVINNREKNICSDIEKIPHIRKEINNTINSTKNYDLYEKNIESKPVDTKSSLNDLYENDNSKGDRTYVLFEKEAKKELSDKLPSLRVLGQVNSTFIICEGESEMFIIDQHAAHERVYFEKYMRDFKKFSLRTQPLLVPIVVEVTLSEKQTILQNLTLFERLGYTIEDFGGNALSIREVPILFGSPDPRDIFNEILENIEDLSESKITSCTDKIIYSMACKSAIKAGDNLKVEEIEKLLENLKMCESPYTCPHGRPTIIKMSYIELQKKFKRIQ